MPNFPKNTGYALKGSEFYGHSNQSPSPNKGMFSKKTFLEQQQNKEAKT